MQNLRNYLPPKSIDTVVYHFPCCDGFGSAYVFWKYLKNNGAFMDQIQFIPWYHSYTEDDVRENIKPLIEGKNVVFVDMVPPTNVLVEAVRMWPNKAIVLDHHKGNQKLLNEYPILENKHVYFDMEKSGATLAWQFCYPDADCPRFLRLIEDRDIWKKEFEETDAFVAAFYNSVPFDFEEYAKYESETTLEALIGEGRIVLKYQNIQIEKSIVPHAKRKTVTIDGKTYKVFVINTNVYISDIGHVLARDEECDFAIMWLYNHHKALVKVSLRSDKTKENFVDVSEIAKKFGGNGHPAAAGFNVKFPDIFDKITEKTNNSYSKYINPILLVCGFGASFAAGTFLGTKINKD